ncbi:MAG TPA: ARMT1-like domain-containing protein [Syntrophorhabdus sp.]|nr:ARMT1-like domain-containing protein [Syntrophorhabdus sp.]
MFMQADYCIPCMLKMSVEIIRGVTKDEKQVRKFMTDILKIKALRWEKVAITPPEVARDVWFRMQQFSSIEDPLRATKAEQNKKALKIYPFIKEILHESSDPILEALKFAIAGNSIDAMLDAKRGMDSKIIKLLSSINVKDVEVLKRRFKKAKKIVYFTDNCGEIVFDRLLIERIKEVYNSQVTAVTRTVPILNDAIMEEALSIGLGEVTMVIENGIQEPLPGTILSKVSPEIKAVVEESDLIISKGGGNYETLTEEESLKGRITYLFQAKCYPYCRIHNVPLGALIVYNN